MCWSPYPRCDGREVTRSWRWSPRDGISVLRRKLSRELASSLFSTLWGHNEKMAMCKPGRRFSPETESEMPSSWIPSLQNWQKYMYIVYKWTQRVAECRKMKKWSRFLEEMTFGSYAARVPFSSHLHQCLLFLVFLIKTFLTEVRWHFTIYFFYLQKGANYYNFFLLLCWVIFAGCGLSLVVLHRHLTAVASRVTEHRL